MPTRKNHLDAARVHGRKAVNELRHMTADSALFWVLANRGRVAQFRRSVKGTRAAKPFDKLLLLIRKEASALPRPVARKRKAVRARRRRPVPLTRYLAQPFLIG
jgi:hypothetical protein